MKAARPLRGRRLRQRIGSDTQPLSRVKLASGLPIVAGLSNSIGCSHRFASWSDENVKDENVTGSLVAEFRKEATVGRVGQVRDENLNAYLL